MTLLILIFSLMTIINPPGEGLQERDTSAGNYEPKQESKRPLSTRNSADTGNVSVSTNWENLSDIYKEEHQTRDTLNPPNDVEKDFPDPANHTLILVLSVCAVVVGLLLLQGLLYNLRRHQKNSEQ